MLHCAGTSSMESSDATGRAAKPASAGKQCGSPLLPLLLFASEWGFCLAQYFHAAVVQELLLTEVRRVCLLFTPQAEGEVRVLHFVPTCFLQTKRCFQHCVHLTVLVLWSWPLQALKPQPCVHSNWEGLEKCCSDCVGTGIRLKHRLSSAGCSPRPPPFLQHRLRQSLQPGVAAQFQPWEAAHELCRW